MAPFFGFTAPMRFMMRFMIILPNGGFGGEYLHEDEYFQRGIEVLSNNGTYIADRIHWGTEGIYQGVIHVVDQKTWAIEVSHAKSKKMRENTWHALCLLALLIICYILFRS